MKAYYFAQNDNKLRYGDSRAIVVGKMHTVKYKPILCVQGLHGSVKPIDALQYAPGSMLYVVNISRNIDIGPDKICGQRREYLFGFNAAEILFLFARRQALINIEKIKPYTDKYDLIVTYLNTGDESLKSAAKSAARHAAESAAWVARHAAESAAWVARHAAKSAACAARHAAKSAACAARHAAKSAACAAESAAESAARHAAESAAWVARHAAKSAACAAESAAESAARHAANKMLEELIVSELTKRGYTNHA